LSSSWKTAGAIPVAYSPDGKTLASGGVDSTVLLWDLTGRTPNALPARLAATDLETRWSDLAGADAPRAFQAIWDLTSNPDGALPLLKAKLPSEAVLPAEVTRLIADLASDRFATRDRATQKLEKMDDVVEPALRKALKDNRAPEVRNRLEQILQKLEGAVPPERLRTLRAIQALEYMGTPEAVDLLKSLVGGAPAAQQTREAKAALERLAHRAAVP